MSAYGAGTLLGWMVRKSFMIRLALDGKRSQLWKYIWVGWLRRGNSQRETQ